MDPVIFIDRDGVINVDPIGDYIKRWEDFRFEPGALEALKKLNAAGYQIVLISNQAGIGDGVYPESELWNIHANMLEVLKKEGVPIRAAYYCLHGKEAGCGCRKPEPGLFEKAAEEMEINREGTYFIGDKVSDVTAGKRFGLKTILVRTGHGQTEEAKLTDQTRPEWVCDNLLQAVEKLLS